MDSPDPLRKKIVEHFKTLPRVEYIFHFLFQSPDKVTYFIKHGYKRDIIPESETQKYLYELAQQDASAPRIPKVYDVFDDSWIWFIVMEYVEGQTLEECSPSEAVSLAASAVGWLIRQQPLSPAIGTVTGVKGSCLRHRFFYDNRAPLAFETVKALENFVNYVMSLSPPPRPSPLSFESAPLVIYHSDISKDNFLIDADHRIWMIDFQHIGVLPLPFCQFALFNIDNNFARAVGAALNYEHDEHSWKMVQVANMLRMTAGSSFRFDVFGNRVPLKKTDPTKRKLHGVPSTSAREKVKKRKHSTPSG